MLWNSLLSAPSAAPTSVSVSAVTSSSIIIQWGSLDCIHHNGDIIGYAVQYGVIGSENMQMMSVSGRNATEITILNLIFSTQYSIKVAAIGENDVGVYSSPPITAVTDGQHFQLHDS